MPPTPAKSSHQTSPCRAALAEIIKLAEAQTLGREGIEVRRLDFTAEATEIRVSHVIGHDEDDVGLVFTQADGCAK
jgi:hypothetical protein